MTIRTWLMLGSCATLMLVVTPPRAAADDESNFQEQVKKQRERQREQRKRKQERRKKNQERSREQQRHARESQRNGYDDSIGLDFYQPRHRGSGVFLNLHLDDFSYSRYERTNGVHYRSSYPLDRFLPLPIYHFRYDPECAYPRPSDTIAIVPDPLIPPDGRILLDGVELAAVGNDAFRARDFANAVRWLRHAAVELPEDRHVVLLLSQALFATGQYEEAAGAAQQGLLSCEDPDEWGVVVKRFREYYSEAQDYHDQLKAIEYHVRNKPHDPAARFLLGYHYGLLGHAAEAVRELDVLLRAAPRDQLARELHDVIVAEIPPATNPSPASKPAPLPVQDTRSKRSGP